MRRVFDTLEVMRGLGVAPSTASVIAGLLSGEVNPDNFRSVQVFALKQFGEVPLQPVKILVALGQILDAGGRKPEELELAGGVRIQFIDRGDNEIPTVIWNEQMKRFSLVSVKEYSRNR